LVTNIEQNLEYWRRYRIVFKRFKLNN